MTLAPVNIAKPRWQCPICETDHGSDYDAAVECVALGPADGGGAAPEVAVWNHGSGLQILRLGPVARRYVDADGNVTRYDGAPAHVQVYDDGTPATFGVGHEPGDLLERGHVGLDEAYAPGQTADTGLDGFLHAIGDFYKEKRRPEAWPQYSKYDHHDTSGYYSTMWEAPSGWLGPLTDDVRQVFEILLADRWEQLTAVSATDDVHDDRHRLRGEWRWGGVHTVGRDGMTSGFGFPLRRARYAVAVAHGFSRHDTPGVTRWLHVHGGAVTDWLHDRLYRWVAGDDVTIPAITAKPVVARPGYGSGLPKKPNKRRTEPLAHWGIDPVARESRWYRDVVDAALASIAVDPPDRPVPGVPDAAEFRSL